MVIAVLANDGQWKELTEGYDEKLFVRLSSLQDKINDSSAKEFASHSPTGTVAGEIRPLGADHRRFGRDGRGICAAGGG